MGSMLLPGLGQFMNGETVKGFMLLALSLLMISRQADFLSPAYILITAIAMIDAALGQARRDRRSFA
jgi:TM2 domain-containing membrane protein YozV